MASIVMVPRAQEPSERLEGNVTFGLSTQDPRFHDRAWLQTAYVQHGDMWIALELGCDRKTIRRQRERMNILSLPPGRRRGAPQAIIETSDTFTEALNLVAERVRNESLLVSSRQQLADRVRDLAREQDPDAINDLLIAVASTALRLHHDRQQYQQAA
jgi:hypothetical protein